MQKNKTILVIRTTAMGDVAMTVPVVEQFLSQNENVNIVFLTSKRFDSFFRYIKHGVVVETIDLHGEYSGIKGIIRMYKDLTSKYEIDEIIDLQVKIYSIILSFIFRILKGVKTIRLDKGKAEKREIIRRSNKLKRNLPKMLYRYADTLRKSGFCMDFTEIPYTNRKEPLPKDFSFLAGEHLIGFSPFASFVGKQIPSTTVRSVIELLISRMPNYKILIFGGGRYEKMFGESLESFYTDHVYSAIGKIDLSSEMDLMSNLEAMITMDSSAQHICSLLGVKVVTIWGATQPLTGFLGYALNEEKNVISCNLDCSPCSVYGDKPCYKGTSACLSQITAESIVNKVISLIESSQE